MSSVQVLGGSHVRLAQELCGKSEYLPCSNGTPTILDDIRYPDHANEGTEEAMVD